MTIPGDQLGTLLQGHPQEVVWVAPFIKAPVIERLFAHLPSTTAIRCVTRWQPDEIAAGVSDLEVWPLFRERARATLFLKPRLHAKYYRADGRCLVGSANLTETALGWHQPNNLELLVLLEATRHGLPHFEREAFAKAVPVDNDLYRVILEAVAQLPKPIPPSSLVNEDAALYHTGGQNACQVSHEWLPSVRHPSDLYWVYCGQGERVTRAAQQAAAADLRALNIPDGLGDASFRACVGAVLLQQTVVWAVDRFVSQPQRFGAVRDFLQAQQGGPTADFDASRAWQTLMRWLLFFLPDRYEMKTPNHSEVFSRRS